jgi:ferredoxin
LKRVPIEVTIDYGLCMGAGECIACAPAIFEWSADKTQARVAVAKTDDEEIVREAALRCPNFAVSVRAVI